MNNLIKTGIRFLAILALFFLLLAVLLFGIDYYFSLRGFPVGVTVGRLDVSSLPTEAAIKKLKDAGLKDVFSPLVTFEARDIRFTFAPEEAGISFDAEQSVGQALEQLRGMDYLKSFRMRFFGGEVHYPAVLSVNDATLLSLLNALAQKIDRPSKEAGVEYYEETGGYHIVTDQSGRTLLIEESLLNIQEAVKKATPVLPLSVLYKPARITEKMLRANPPVYRLSKYTTFYGAHDSPNRIHNIKLIASWIEGRILLPGERFSVAQVLGRVTSERGFKEAYVIMGGELVPLLGGGSCQIATTLYNAVSLADLNVLQRRNHSFYFNIYPLGRDAGVYPGQLDMVFENNTSHPVLIKALATDKRLSFGIYGTPTGKKVEFSSPAILGRNSAGIFVPMSLRDVIRLDVPFKTLVERKVYAADGTLTKQETINSYYRMYGEKTNVPIRRREPR